MKRFVLGILALTLVLCLSLPCMAAKETLSVTGGKAAAGEMVYLTVHLEKPVKANTVGITCQFDKALLAAQPELSAWSVNALLAAFEQNNMGAWAVSGETELKGKLCVLAFQVKADAAFDTTEVACTVKFKTDTKEVGEYTSKATVSCVCQHSYGDWKSAGSLGHERVCSVCGGKNTQSHEWDDGTEKEGKDGMTVITKTCLVCKGQDTVKIPAGSFHGPVVEPEKDPPDAQKPQGGTVTPGQGTQTGTDLLIGQDGSIINSQTGDVIVPGGADSSMTVGADNHDHSHEVPTDGDGHDYSHKAPTQADGHDHVHTVGGLKPVTLWVTLGVLAAAVIAAVVFVKKR